MARVELQIGDELLARVDVARGFEPRASFIRRVLVAELDGVNSTRGTAAFERQYLAGLRKSWDDPHQRLYADVADVAVGSRPVHLPTCSCGVCRPAR